MRILALDTSTEWCSVAVGDAGAWLERSEHVGQAHSERLLPMVDAALAAAQWAPVDLDAIAFGCGPGSFTGIRIGCAVAQGLAFALDRPLLGVPTLEAIAARDRDRPQRANAEHRPTESEREPPRNRAPDAAAGPRPRAAAHGYGRANGRRV